MTGCEDAERVRATVQLVREPLIAGGVAQAAEIEPHPADVAAGRLDLAQPPMVTAWGRWA